MKVVSLGGQPGAPLCTGLLRPFPQPPAWAQVVCWAETILQRTAEPGYLWTQGRREPSLLPYLARPVNTHTSLAGSMTPRAGSGDAATSNQTDTNRRGSASGRQQRLRLGICVWDPCTAQWQVRKERRMGPLACLTGNTGPLWSLEWKLLTGGPERSSLWSTWLESSCYKKTSFKNGLIQSALAGWL